MRNKSKDHWQTQETEREQGERSQRTKIYGEMNEAKTVISDYLIPDIFITEGLMNVVCITAFPLISGYPSINRQESSCPYSGQTVWVWRHGQLIDTKILFTDLWRICGIFQCVLESPLNPICMSLRLWEEAGVPKANRHRHRENMQTPHRKTPAKLG